MSKNRTPVRIQNSISFDTSAGGGQIAEKAHLSGVPEKPGGG